MALKEFEDVKVVINTLAENSNNLLPLTANRTSGLLFVSGKSLLEWAIFNCQKMGFKEFIIIVSKENNDEIQKLLTKNMDREDNREIKLDFIEISSKKGFSQENRTLMLDSLLTNYSLWIESKIVFTTKFLEEFELKLKGKNRFALVKTIGGSKHFWGLGYFSKNDLNTNLLGAKSIGDIYSRISQKSSSPFPVLEFEQNKMEYWKIEFLFNLLDANQVLINYVEKQNEGIIEEGVTLIGKVTIEKGARIRSGSYIEGPVFVGKDCDIGPNCFLRQGTVLQQEVRIGNACELKNTIVLKGSHIAHLSYVGDSIIGENCNFGAGTMTGNLRLDNKAVKIQIFDEKVISSERRKLGVIMGDNVKTAINTYFMPGVIIGNNSVIGTGVIVNRNIQDNTFVYLEQQTVIQKWNDKSNND